jgi:hypothetical protein
LFLLISIGIAMNLPTGDFLYEKGKNIHWKSYETWIENQLQGKIVIMIMKLYIA